MNNLKKLIALIFLISIGIITFYFVAFLVSYLFFDNRSSEDIYTYTEKKININIHDCKIDSDFIDDENVYTVFNCNKTNITEYIKNWKKLPMPKSLMESLYGNNNSIIGPAETFEIPTMYNGYYYYLNSSNSDTQNHEFSDLDNVILVLYDSTSNYMYYYEQKEK